MGGKHYGLTSRMLIGGEIEPYEIAIVKKNHLWILSCLLEIIETRAISDKSFGRIETQSVDNTILIT